MKWGKTFLVVFAAVVITALGIDAADTIQGNEGTLLSQVISRKSDQVCPAGMTEVFNIPNITCVDIYEASPNQACPIQNPEQMVGTITNVDSPGCGVESKKDVLPWRFITRDQAMQMCARVSKRIPTSEEWYALSLGMSAVEASCNVSTKQISRTGAQSSCISPHGAYDLVGNVWEWVSDDVINGIYKSNPVPDSGYIAQVDAEGMPTVVTDSPGALFGSDYFWSKREGAYGIIRGGYYDSGTDGGIYTLHAGTVPTTASIGIGFRCVK